MTPIEQIQNTDKLRNELSSDPTAFLHSITRYTEYGFQVTEVEKLRFWILFSVERIISDPEVRLSLETPKAETLVFKRAVSVDSFDNNLVVSENPRQKSLVVGKLGNSLLHTVMETVLQPTKLFSDLRDELVKKYPDLEFDSQRRVIVCNSIRLSYRKTKEGSYAIIVENLGEIDKQALEKFKETHFREKRLKLLAKTLSQMAKYFENPSNFAKIYHGREISSDLFDVEFDSQVFERTSEPNGYSRKLQKALGDELFDRDGNMFLSFSAGELVDLLEKDTQNWQEVSYPQAKKAFARKDGIYVLCIDDLGNIKLRFNWKILEDEIVNKKIPEKEEERARIEKEIKILKDFDEKLKRMRED